MPRPNSAKRIKTKGKLSKAPSTNATNIVGVRISAPVVAKPIAFAIAGAERQKKLTPAKAKQAKAHVEKVNADQLAQRRLRQRKKAD